jgi:hypothetical protein
MSGQAHRYRRVLVELLVLRDRSNDGKAVEILVLRCELTALWRQFATTSPEATDKAAFGQRSRGARSAAGRGSD